MTAHDDIRIGTLVPGPIAPGYIAQVLPYGFESFQLTFGERVGEVDLGRLADDVRQVLDRSHGGAVVSALGAYGNPLASKESAHDWQRLVEAAGSFGCPVVAGFAGRVPGKPVPDSIDRFREVFSPLADRAGERGVRLALENCEMGGTWQSGDWNIAHSPRAWELIFEAVPSEALGLEWEPCHQMCSLIDPLPQLRQWAPKVFHVHGKDANVLWDVVGSRGIRGGERFAWHRTPGFGDTNWAHLISILRQYGYRGSIDVEGWHDPVYCGELEMTGQVRALRYLVECRGGPVVENPQ